MLSDGRVLVVLLATGLAAGGARAQVAAVPAAAAPAPPAAGMAEITLRARVESLRAQLDSARKSAETTRIRVKVGMIPPADAEKAEERVKVLEAALKESEARLQREDRLVALERPLNLRLTDASLRQAAIALSEAAGLPVVVDEGVSGDKRLTLDARGVTLGLLLETLAEKSDLMIAPDEKGVRIQRWPVLEVDGRQVVRRSTMAPWSDEWVRYLPTADVWPVGLLQEAAPDPNAPAAPVPATPPRAPVAPRLPFSFVQQFGGMPGGGVSLAPVGDRNVVVAEPGVGEKGEAGYWLTVYRLEGDGLRKLSSVFHPSRSPQPSPRGFFFNAPYVERRLEIRPPGNRFYVRPGVPVQPVQPVLPRVEKPARPTPPPPGPPK